MSNNKNMETTTIQLTPPAHQKISTKKKQLIEALGQIGTVDVEDDMALVCCIGEGMRYSKGLLRNL